jgi:NADH:ubiquinone oxidoreductase subunit 6 (subunit J)
MVFLVLLAPILLYLLLSQNTVRLLMVFLAVLVLLAFLYFALGAEAAGSTQLLVYAGGIAVLLLFGVLSAQQSENKPYSARFRLLASVSLAVAIVVALAEILLPLLAPLESISIVQTKALSLPGTGKTLILQNGFALEAAALFLLAALAASAGLVMKTEKTTKG